MAARATLSSSDKAHTAALFNYCDALARGELCEAAYEVLACSALSPARTLVRCFIGATILASGRACLQPAGALDTACMRFNCALDTACVPQAQVHSAGSGMACTSSISTFRL